MYQKIKIATGKATQKTAPLKSKSSDIISDKPKQLERWVEHYLELYSHENKISQPALDALENLHVMKKLDAKPTTLQLSKAIDAFSACKAPGQDGIPPDIIKSGKTVLLKPLLELLHQYWSEREVPQDMRDA